MATLQLCQHENEAGTLNIFFLTNEFTKEAEITILSARDTTRPGLQAVGSWVMT